MLKSGGAQDSFSTIKRVLGSALGDTLIGNAAYVDGQLNFIRSGSDTGVFYGTVTVTV